MKVDFQILHSFNATEDIKDQILILLKDALEDSFIEKSKEGIDEWMEINEWIEVKYDYQKSDSDFILGFSLLIDEEEDADRIIDGFSKTLRSTDEVHMVLKFLDQNVHERFKIYVREIFEIEMKLREVISFIFIDTYNEEYYDLLREIDVRTQKLSGNQQPDEEYYRNHLENEFFFLLFSDYIRLDELKQVKLSELIQGISDFEDYSSLREKVLNINRGIANEKYREFLAEIKDSLQTIEDLRNCVAHNRSISGRVKGNYEIAKERLEKSMEAFWEAVQSKN